MHCSRSLVWCALLLSSASSCGTPDAKAGSAQSVAAAIPPGAARTSVDSPRVIVVSQMTADTRATLASRDTAMFAGGCFWSMERPFDHVPGVVSTTVGYAGGRTKNPTYEQVNTRTTGHTETVLVEYDPAKLTYEKLLDVYWHNIDPITRDRQFCDAGPDYRTVIFTHGARQQTAALRSKEALQQSGRFKVPVVTEVVANAPFWRGEDYHQHFADRNPQRYEAYRRGCGRDARLRELWGDAASPYVPEE
ncbi:MAG: peptide-methionine (S)-S-oxide reductase MsrA [Gemmatimonadaceae bacterium]